MNLTTFNVAHLHNVGSIPLGGLWVQVNIEGHRYLTFEPNIAVYWVNMFIQFDRLLSTTCSIYCDQTWERLQQILGNRFTWWYGSSRSFACKTEFSHSLRDARNSCFNLDSITSVLSLAEHNGSSCLKRLTTRTHKTKGESWLSFLISIFRRNRIWCTTSSQRSRIISCPELTKFTLSSQWLAERKLKIFEKNWIISMADSKSSFLVQWWISCGISSRFCNCKIKEMNFFSAETQRGWYLAHKPLDDGSTGIGYHYVYLLTSLYCLW